MSAEAPRNSGTGEPLPPQEPKSGFLGFLNRFFGLPPEIQPTQQPPSKIVQLPPELSDFAIRLNKGIEDELDMARKTELQRIEREKQLVERSKREKEAREQQGRQLIEGRLQTLGEIKQIAEDLRIRDRLGYINATVWEGKGVIREISTDPKSAYSGLDSTFPPDYNPQAAFELKFSYQSAQRQDRQGHHGGYSYRFALTTETTSLQVCVHSVNMNKGRYLDVISTSLIEEKWEKVTDQIRWGVYRNNDDHRVDWVHGPYVWEGYRWMVGFGDVPVGVMAINRIPLDSLPREEVEEKLTLVLLKETKARVKKGHVPSRLILAGQESIRKAKIDPQWMNWKEISGPARTD